MPNIFKNFLNSMKLTEDDNFEDDILDDEDEMIESRKSRLAEDADSAQSRQQSRVQSSNDNKKERMKSVERRPASKVVPMRSTPKGLEVCIIKPTSFEDSQVICDMLLTGRATVINLEGVDDYQAQRTMDFVSGSVYAINGKLHRISSSIFIVSPDTVDISGDYLDMIKDDNFDPPTFNSKF